MSVTLREPGSPTPAPDPASDPWVALLVALDLAMVAGLVDDWSSAVNVLAAVLALFTAYREARR